MTTFVEQILQHMDQFQLKTIHEKMDALSTELKKLTVDMHQLAQSKYVDFKPSLAMSENLEARVETVQKDMSHLEDKIHNKIDNQLAMPANEFQSLNGRLKEAKVVYEGLEHLAKILQLLEVSKLALEDKKYSGAATAISEAMSLLKHPLTSQDEKIPIFVALKMEVAVRKGELDCTLSDLWKDFISWNIIHNSKTAHPEANLSSIQEVSLTVSCEGVHYAELRELVKAMYKENLLALQFKSFADRFKKFIVPLILEYPTLRIDKTTSGAHKTLRITRQKDLDTKSDKKGKNSADLAVASGVDKSYIPVFSNLLDVMEELNLMLLGAELSNDMVQLKDSDTNITSSDCGSTLMAWLGRETSALALDLLQKTVISKAIPSSARDLEGFTEVVSAVKIIHERLTTIGYIQSDDGTLLRYVQNVNMLFSNKKSQSILVEARDLMTSDLHNSMSVAEDKPMGEWPPLTPGGVKKVQRLEVASEHQLSDSTFRMPKCRISETVQTLMIMAYETLEEASESAPECALQMYLAVRSIFEMFCDVVPTHHGKSFEEFPQIAALHHNNCMFIAHHLMTLGHQFESKLPNLISPFVDLIEKIRGNGVRVFLAQIERQQGLLLECLEGAQGFGQLEEKTRTEGAERSIKQVILQLEHLQKIWKPVLPINIYKKAMGRLINSVVKYITDCVCALEDIAQTAAHALLSLLAPLEPACGNMLALPGEEPVVELPRHAPAWCRLGELRQVLDASLAQVGDRWAGGHGPLAVAYLPSEVKQLVRALFQNTDRRAALLATIR